MKIDRLPKTILRYKFFWLACCLILAANLAGYIVVVRGQRNKIDEFHNQYIKIRKLSTQSSKKYRESTGIYLKAKNDLNRFTDLLPAVVHIADKARELNAVLDKHDFSISKLTFTPDKTNALSLWKYTTSFRVTGEYAKLKTLLAEIQNLPGLFCIENLNLKSEKDKNLVNMTFRIATYFK